METYERWSYESHEAQWFHHLNGCIFCPRVWLFISRSVDDIYKYSSTFMFVWIYSEMMKISTWHISMSWSRLQWQNFHDICRQAACECYLPESVFFLILVAYTYIYIIIIIVIIAYIELYIERQIKTLHFEHGPYNQSPLIHWSHPSFPVQVIRQKAWCLSKSPQVACVNHWEMVSVCKQVPQSGASELLFNLLTYVYRLVQVYLQVISHLI